MIVTWLGHASVFLNAAGKTLLIDPWFAEPVFEDARYRYPPSPYPFANSIPRPDFLLLTSARPDHAGAQTLAQFKKDTPTLATCAALKPHLETAAFNDVRWLSAWETKELAPGLRVTFVPGHDGSSAIIEADDVRLYVGGANALSIETYREIARRLGPFDLALLPCDAGSTKAAGLQRFFDGLEGLKPAEAAPYASSWATLDSTQISTNFASRPTYAEVLAAGMKVAHEHGAHLAHLEPGDEWSRDTGAINKGLSEGWPQDVEAVRRYAKQLGVNRAS